VPLGDPLSNVIWCLEQASREMLESMMIPWDFGKNGNACKLVKLVKEG